MAPYTKYIFPAQLQIGAVPREVAVISQHRHLLVNGHFLASVTLFALAGNQVLADGGSISLKTGAVVEVTGDAIINNRKKKLIPSYELQIKGTWSGWYLPIWEQFLQFTYWLMA